MQRVSVRFFLIFICISSYGFERIGPRRSASQSQLPHLDVQGPPVAPKEFGPRTQEFDFFEHRMQKHTKTVSYFEDGQMKEEIVEAACPITMRPDHTYSSIHEAAMANDEKGIERFLVSDYRGLLVNAYDEDGQTALQCAVDYACDKAIACLINAGARADFPNRASQYTAWTLAQFYSESTGHMNVVPLMALQQALAQKGELGQYHIKKKKTRVLEQRAAQDKPRKIIRLRRNPARQLPAPELQADPEPDYDPYSLNV